MIAANIITPISMLYTAFGWRWHGGSDRAAKKARWEQKMISSEKAEPKVNGSI
jgi:hypothetical protein